MVAMHVAVLRIACRQLFFFFFFFNAVPIPIDYRTVQLAAQASELLGVKADQYICVWDRPVGALSPTIPAITYTIFWPQCPILVQAGVLTYSPTQTRSIPALSSGASLKDFILGMHNGVGGRAYAHLPGIIRLH